jgi:hypothetical protein
MGRSQRVGGGGGAGKRRTRDTDAKSHCHFPGCTSNVLYDTRGLKMHQAKPGRFHPTITKPPTRVSPRVLAAASKIFRAEEENTSASSKPATSPPGAIVKVGIRAMVDAPPAHITNHCNDSLSGCGSQQSAYARLGRYDRR